MDGPVKSPASMSSSFSSALRSLLERGTVAVSARCAQSLPSRGGEDAPGLVSGGAAGTTTRPGTAPWRCGRRSSLVGAAFLAGFFATAFARWAMSAFAREAMADMDALVTGAGRSASCCSCSCWCWCWCFCCCFCCCFGCCFGCCFCCCCCCSAARCSRFTTASKSAALNLRSVPSAATKPALALLA